MSCKKHLLLYLLVTIHLLVNAQINREPNNQLKFAPLRLIDPVHSGFEISYEKRYNDRFSTQGIAGYLTKGIFNNDYKNYKGYRLGIEQKYFYTLRRGPERYLSVELITQKNSFNTVGGFDHDSTNTSPSFTYKDTITIRRKATIFNVRLGRQLVIWHLVADISIGIGVRFRTVIHEGKIYPGDKLIAPRHPNVHYEANREKRDAALNIPMNIRLGFTF
jgi:hypothetical protein